MPRTSPLLSAQSPMADPRLTAKDPSPASPSSQNFAAMLQSNLGATGALAHKSPGGGLKALEESGLLDLNKMRSMAAVAESPQTKASILGDSGVTGLAESRGIIKANNPHPYDLGYLVTSKSRDLGPRENELMALAKAGETSLSRSRRAGLALRRKGTGGQASGELSSAHESGGRIDAIGYDAKGGTSYGLYQLASGTGSMNRFLNYLSEKAPDLCKRLEKAGPANTGSREGAMPDEWRRISAEQPQRFEALQQDFIRATYYEQAAAQVGQSTGLDLAKHSVAVREVLWSTSVQHGQNGATSIFERAVAASGDPNAADFDKRLIDNVYKIRQGQFGGSSARVRTAVRGRLADEHGEAVAMLAVSPGKNGLRSTHAASPATAWTDAQASRMTVARLQASAAPTPSADPAPQAG